MGTSDRIRKLGARLLLHSNPEIPLSDNLYHKEWALFDRPIHRFVQEVRVHDLEGISADRSNDIRLTRVERAPSYEDVANLAHDYVPDTDKLDPYDQT